MGGLRLGLRVALGWPQPEEEDEGGAEYSPDPGFDNPSAWTITGAGVAAVADGVLTASGGFGTRVLNGVPAVELTPGTYEATFTVVSRTAGSARPFIDGVFGTNRTTVGTHTEQLVVTEVGEQLLGIQMLSSPNLVVDDFHVVKIA